MKPGDQFNYLTAVQHDRSDSKNSFWEFECVCGVHPIIRAGAVKSGDTKSCGCMKSELLRTREPVWRKPEGDADRNALLNSYRHNAVKRGLRFDLTVEEFATLTQGQCHYCGVSPQQGFDNPRRNGVYVYNGIDRIDNVLDYTIENCVPCCGICNRAKSNLSIDEFEAWLERLLRFQLTKESR